MFSGPKNNSGNEISNVGGSVRIGDDIINQLPEPGLTKQVKKHLLSKQIVDAYCESLQVYMTSKSVNPMIGLEKKLEAADVHCSYIQDALEYKEKFFLELTRNYNSLAYQKIIYEMICEAVYLFGEKIRPLIIAGVQGNDLVVAVYKEVVSKIYDEISGLDGLDIDKLSLKGLVYFVTGNCYLKWSL